MEIIDRQSVLVKDYVFSDGKPSRFIGNLDVWTSDQTLIQFLMTGVFDNSLNLRFMSNSFELTPNDIEIILFHGYNRLHLQCERQYLLLNTFLIKYPPVNMRQWMHADGSIRLIVRFKGRLLLPFNNLPGEIVKEDTSRNGSANNVHSSSRKTFT